MIDPFVMTGVGRVRNQMFVGNKKINMAWGRTAARLHNEFAKGTAIVGVLIFR